MLSRPRTTPIRFRIGSPALLAFLILVSGGCAGGGTGPSSREPERAGAERTSGGGSLFDQIEARRRAQREQPRNTFDPQAGAAGMPAGWKPKFDAAWSRFLKNDPGWREVRDEWVALGPQAVSILVENLIRVYVLAHDAGDGPTYYRARDELAVYKDESIPYLVEGLSGDNKADSVVRNLCSDLLAWLGDPALPAIEKAYGRAGQQGRAALARALKKMQSRASIPLLMEIAGGSDDFAVRIEALDTLGRMGAKEAAPVMRRCLSDGDVSVRKFAATWIGALGDGSPGVLEDLVECLERALGRNEGEIARACRASLKRLSGQDHGLDPARWRSWIRSGAAAPRPGGL